MTRAILTEADLLNVIRWRLEGAPVETHKNGRQSTFDLVGISVPIQANENPVAAILESMRGIDGRQEAVDGIGTCQEERSPNTLSSLTTISRLVEKALLHDEAIRRRALKGAAGQKAAADERCKKLAAIARSLIAERCRSFDSYRQLAAAVARQPGVLESERTIRQHLATARVLES